MSYLLYGNSAHTLMGWVDAIPRCPGLFIGGLYALHQTDLITAAGVTHVLSVIDYDVDEHLRQARFKHLHHLHIQVQDDPNEDLLRHFERVCKWIEDGLTGGEEARVEGIAARGTEDGPGGNGGSGRGGVFVHCAMGKSRSAAVVCAYLMWRFGVGWEEGMRWVCEGRPVCEPTVGFREQLGVWERMLRVSEERRRDLYEEWERGRFVGEWWEWERRAAKGEVGGAAKL